jgi:hypothetical protein
LNAIFALEVYDTLDAAVVAGRKALHDVAGKDSPKYCICFKPAKVKRKKGWSVMVRSIKESPYVPSDSSDHASDLGLPGGEQGSLVVSQD